MAESSQAKIDANRRNALKSTGPRTPEGKAVSRANALTHGLCAQVVDIPGEDPTILAVRDAVWQDELNPLGRAAQAYLIHQAVRRTGRLDRLDTVYNAKVAQLSRDALNARKKKRCGEVEDLARLIHTDPDIATRRLKQTPEGCEFLIQEWENLRQTLVPPAHFDGDDESIVIRLVGRLSSHLRKSPSPIGLAKEAIQTHREVAQMLLLNENPEALMWDLRYKNKEQHERDRARIETLAIDAEAARVEILGILNQAVADLREQKATLELEEAIEVNEASLRARFDASDEGKLIHRYEIESERSLLRCLNEVRVLNAAEARTAQTQVHQPVMPIRPVVPPVENPARPARNEATSRREDDPFAHLEQRVLPGGTGVPIKIVPKSRSPVW